MEPSYSTMTNAPSQQTGEVEGTGWNQSVLPSLGKMESAHLA